MLKSAMYPPMMLKLASEMYLRMDFRKEAVCEVVLFPRNVLFDVVPSAGNSHSA